MAAFAPSEQDAPFIFGCEVLVSTGRRLEKSWSMSTAWQHLGKMQEGRAQPKCCLEELCLISLPVLCREGARAKSFNMRISIWITRAFTAASEHVSPSYHSRATAFKDKCMSSSLCCTDTSMCKPNHSFPSTTSEVMSWLGQAQLKAVWSQKHCSAFCHEGQKLCRVHPLIKATWCLFLSPIRKPIYGL